MLRRENGSVLCQRCELAERPAPRMRGLLGRSGLAPGTGMLFRPAGSIHTLFMRFPIDVVFCDAGLVVLHVERDLRPWRTAGARGAKVVVELAAGAAAGVRVGERLILDAA
ncbi:MAG: DUF192 domain-containing protein [Gaiellaceae bacterium]